MSLAPKPLSYHWRSYLPLIAAFRNGPQLAWAHHYRQPLDCAVLWSGTVIRNAGTRGGFVDTVVEIWGHQEYAPRGFYAPANHHVVLDLGANVGLFSLWIAHHAREARVIAFEPHPENFATLQSNTRGYRIETHCAALSATSGLGHVVDGGERSLDHRLVIGDGTVPVLTLDRAVALAESDRIDLLKVDIEGAEADMLAAASPDTLRRCQRIVLEYHDHVRPGGLTLITQVLARTHTIHAITGDERYGMLYAERTH